jgi:hypothetical protein
MMILDFDILTEIISYKIKSETERERDKDNDGLDLSVNHTDCL